MEHEDEAWELGMGIGYGEGHENGDGARGCGTVMRPVCGVWGCGMGMEYGAWGKIMGFRMSSGCASQIGWGREWAEHPGKNFFRRRV